MKIESQALAAGTNHVHDPATCVACSTLANSAAKDLHDHDLGDCALCGDLADADAHDHHSGCMDCQAVASEVAREAGLVAAFEAVDRLNPITDVPGTPRFNEAWSDLHRLLRDWLASA